MTALAILPAFNELDALPSVLRHLKDQGVAAYLVDNHSTDGTWDWAADWVSGGLLTGRERFPASGPTNTYDWQAILRRIAAVAEEQCRSFGVDWCIKCDCDEILYPPPGWDPAISLAEALAQIAEDGYTVANFRVVNFVPVDEGWDPCRHNLEGYFRYYEEASGYDAQNHQNAWLQSAVGAGKTVDIASTGGHECWFEGAKVFPERFLLKHYGVRSTEHGKRKYFRERKPRLRADEVFDRGFHFHAFNRDPNQPFLGDPEKLKRWGDGKKNLL